MPIITKVVSSNHGEVHSIQHFCDKVDQLLAPGLWFSLGTPVSSTNKTDDITEILLKVALNTKTLTHSTIFHRIYIYSNDGFLFFQILAI